MWETVAERVRKLGGEVRQSVAVERILTEPERNAGGTRRVSGVKAVDRRTNERFQVAADYVFSTMPICDLVRGLTMEVPAEIRAISEGLVYRDFITVGLLLRKIAGGVQAKGAGAALPDNWIYIQEPDVRVGRLQIFNNWSPYLVADSRHAWVGLEYFCNENDELWNRADHEMVALAADELARIGLIDAGDVLDGTVIRVPKTYPAYFGTYARFDELRAWLDGFENLFLIGRNGMHRYNNQDHSMLTAMTVVDNLVAGRLDKANIWAVNTEQEYHEEGS